jgi:acyl carrier protein
MSTEEATRRTQTIKAIAEILEVSPDDISKGDRLREDLGMDSLGSLELLSILSEELRIDLEIEDAMGISTVEDACAFIESSYVAQRGAAQAADG